MPNILSRPLQPGSTIGILGSGQLGRMLSFAASELGLRTHIYSPETGTPAGEVSARETTGDYEDREQLERFAEQVDVITYEFENIPFESADFLNHRKPVFPPPGILQVSQDRLTEKQCINEYGIATAPFANVENREDLIEAIEKIGIPSVLKTRRMGYDGKGQKIIRAESDLAGAFDELGAACILEGYVDFTSEVSVIVARGQNGNVSSYDTAENVHKDHILHTSTVPATISPALNARAQEIAATIVTKLNYIGVMGVELFVTRDQDLLVNEIAPRVHNSGHWTQDACGASQFEQHIRAIAGWPLAQATRHSDAVMENLIGDDINKVEALSREPDTHIHLYGKKEARPGRKMGHATKLKAINPDDL